MTAVLQRVNFSSVSVENKIVGKSDNGMMILLGCSVNDTKEDADLLCNKIAGLRIFEDPDGKMNLSLDDVNGSILLISNFTLAASCRRGRRPDFGNCMKPDAAEPMFQYFKDQLISLGLPVQTGIFGADMTIDMQCNGPVTIILDSTTLRSPRSAE